MTNLDIQGNKIYRKDQEEQYIDDETRKLFTNCLGEYIEPNVYHVKYWYYEIPINAKPKLCIQDFLSQEDTSYMMPKENTWTAMGLSPASALLLLKEYYDKFGYPNPDEQFDEE